MATEFEADGGAFISQNATPASPSLEVEEVQGCGGEEVPARPIYMLYI
jgi:hypothetical protein